MTDTATRPVPPPPPPPGEEPRRRDIRDTPLPLVASIVIIVLVAARFGIWVAITILAIGLMIFLHELGHYIAAKRGGMKVTEFFLGFGPRLWSFTRGETTYGLKAVPFGAYVKVIGMHNLEEVPPEDEPRTYRQASYPRRMAVAVAGSGMHFLQAFVVLMVLYVGFGAVNHDDWRIDKIVDGSAAAQVGMQPGDRPLTIDGQPVGRFDDLPDQLAGKGDEPITITYERNGQVLSGSATAGDRLTKEGATAIDGQGGLRERDQILAVDGQDVSGYSQFAAMATVGSTYTVDVPRGNSVCSVKVTVRDLPPANVATTGFLGLQATYPTQRVDPVHAAGRSVGDFGQITGAALSGMARFVSPGNISGFVSDTFKTTNDQTATACRTIGPEDENRILSIVGVGRLAAEAGRNGVDQFLRFFALINIFIGVLNLIPLLPFDGGHAVIATYERIRSRKNRPYHLDVAKLLPLSYAVFIAFAALGVLALYRDLLDPVRLGG